MKKCLWIAGLTLFGFNTFAQTKYSEALIISNGGSGSIGKFIPESSSYSNISTHSASSTQDLVIDNGIAYVGLVDSIVAYDVISETRLFSAPCDGVTGLHVHDGILWVAKGFGASSNFLEERSLTDLSIIRSYSDVVDQSSSIEILNDTAYIAMPGPFGTPIGRVALVDAVTSTFLKIDTLPGNGEGASRIFVYDNLIHTISDHGFMAPDFSIHRLENGQWQEFAFTGTTSGYSGYALAGDSLLLEVNQETRTIDLTTMQLTSSVFTNRLLSQLVFDDVNQKYYGAEQSYVSNGQLYVFDIQGNIEDSITVGVAPEAIGLAQNNNPLAVEDKSYGINNVVLSVNPLSNDIDDALLVAELVQQPANGTAVLNGNSIEITASSGYIGGDSILYAAIDIWGRRDTTAVYLRWQDELFTQLVDFEDVTFNLSNAYNGADGWGGFPSNGAFFPTVFNFNFWLGGFAASNATDTITPGFGNIYSTIAGSGYGNSTNFGMANGTSGEFLVNSTTGQQISGLFLTNSTYAALSMRDGDGIAKKFGGTTGDDPDYFRVTFIGVDKDGNKTDSVTAYLADYRFTDNSQDFILRDWVWVDFNALGVVTSIQYKLESTDNGAFGMNTPAFFCVDDINAQYISIGEELTNEELQLYPNPTNGLVRFSKNVDSYALYNLLGELVHEGVNVTELNLDGVETGVYLLRYQIGKIVNTQKIVKE